MVFEASSKIDTQTIEQREEAVQTSAQASTVSPATMHSNLIEGDSSSLDEFRGSDVEDNIRKERIKSKKKAKANQNGKENPIETGQQPVIDAKETAPIEEVVKPKVEMADCEVQVDDLEPSDAAA